VGVSERHTNRTKGQTTNHTQRTQKGHHPVHSNTATSPAPDITPGYPSAGTRVGPAWNDLWQRLADGEWHGWLALTTDVAAAHDIQPKTAESLLYAARKSGLIEKHVAKDRKRSYVRRIEVTA
jgi:hypothetical protein